MEKERISQETLQKMSGSKCLETVLVGIDNVFDDNQECEFEVELYEGLGYAFTEHEGRMVDVVFYYPISMFVGGEGDLLAKKIKKALNKEDSKDKVNVVDIFMCYRNNTKIV